MFFIFFTQFIWIDWFAVFYYDFGRFHFREMGFEDVCRIVDSDRDDRAFSLGCDLEASLMEWKHVQCVFVSVSGSLREDADGDAGLYLIYCCEDGFQTLFDVFSVKEETVKVAHPGGQQRNFLHFFFCNIAGTNRTAGVSKKNVKVTSVVADIEYWRIFWHIFFTDHSDFGTGDPEDKAKYCLDDAEGADILFHRREFTDDPFYQKDGNGENQVSDHHDTDENKSYHYSFPFRACMKMPMSY